MTYTKNGLLLFFVLVQSLGLFGQTCGGMNLNSQAAIDNFATTTSGCHQMTGTLTIEGNDITNLNGLAGLTQIDGVLQITNNPNLNGLTGLDNVTSIGGIYMKDNDDPDFKNLQGLNGLTSINGSMFIWYNDYLESFSGLEQLTGTLTYAKIVENVRLSDMSAMSGITEITGNGSADGGGFTVKKNNVQNLNGWQNLTKINTFLSVLLENSLTDISALNSLTEVTGSFAIMNHPQLTNLDGLDNLLTVGGNLTVSNDDVLTDCEALCNLINHDSAASYNVGSNGATSCQIYTDGNGQISQPPAAGTLPAICQSILPVELVTFFVRSAGEKVSLSWQTQSEIDNAGFSIQRSLDGKNWVDIGWVDGHGSTTETWNYDFLDVFPASGIDYYRLMQEDYDGHISASKVVSVLLDGERMGLTVAPNPASNWVYLQSHSDKPLRISIFSSTGQRMFLGSGTKIDVSGYPRGIYFIVAEIEGRYFREKLMVD